MKFYFDQHDGTTKELTYEELREHMSAYQIDEALDTKVERPDMELTYGTVGGRIRFECGESRKYVITYGGTAGEHFIEKNVRKLRGLNDKIEARFEAKINKKTT